MPNKFTIFHQKQYGEYTSDKCEDGNLGACRVGPCVTLFLYNRAEKSCFAMYIDSSFSFQLIFELIETHFENPEALKDYEAFIAGGWEYLDTDDNGNPSTRSSIELDIEALINNLDLKSVSATLHKLQPKINGISDGQFYDVIFNLNAGEIMLLKHGDHDFEAKESNSSEELDFYNACYDYLENSCQYAITQSWHTLVERDPLYVLYDETIEFFEEIIDQNNGMPAIPAHNTRYSAEFEMELLAGAIHSADSLVVIEQLYLSFASPITTPSEWEGNTCLHFACCALEKDPQNFHLKIIVVFLILYAKNDVKNDSGVVALAELNNSELQSFKDICNEILNIFKIYENDGEISLNIVHWYRILSIITVNTIFYCLDNEAEAPEYEIGFLDELRKKSNPEYWVRNRILH